MTLWNDEDVAKEKRGGDIGNGIAGVEVLGGKCQCENTLTRYSGSKWRE